MLVVIILAAMVIVEMLIKQHCSNDNNSCRNKINRGGNIINNGNSCTSNSNIRIDNRNEGAGVVFVIGNTLMT